MAAVERTEVYLDRLNGIERHWEAFKKAVFSTVKETQRYSHEQNTLFGSIEKGGAICKTKSNTCACDICITQQGEESLLLK